MTQQQLEAQVKQLQAENDSLKATAIAGLSCKVSPKTGVICVYGLGRFPVSMRDDRWLKLLAFGSQVEEFIAKPETQTEIAAGQANATAEKAAAKTQAN